MRALAEFVMRGRLQAGAIAVLGYIIPLLTPVTVALVTLRKGAHEGTIVLFLGLAPALLSLVLGEGSSVLVWVTLLSLVVIYIPALILRFTISLANAVASVIAVSAVVAIAVVIFAPSVVGMLSEAVTTMLTAREVPEGSASITVNITAVTVSGMVAYILAANGLIALLIGRWLQAKVYNPGGFGSEYRELRLNVVFALICFAGSVMLRYQGNEFLWWSNVLALPLLLVAFAVMHSIAKAKNLALPWLIGFYFAAFVFTPIVMCIGFVDTWFDFRRRLKES